MHRSLILALKPGPTLEGSNGWRVKNLRWEVTLTVLQLAMEVLLPNGASAFVMFKSGKLTGNVFSEDDNRDERTY